MLPCFMFSVPSLSNEDPFTSSSVSRGAPSLGTDAPRSPLDATRAVAAEDPLVMKRRILKKGGLHETREFPSLSPRRKNASAPRARQRQGLLRRLNHVGAGSSKCARSCGGRLAVSAWRKLRVHLH